MGEQVNISTVLGSEAIQEGVVETLRGIFDPEIPVSIYELGLIYGIEVGDQGDVKIEMTLTTPACPVAVSLPPQVEAEVGSVPGVKSVHVDVVWDPPWTMDMMSEAAKMDLGLE